MTEPVWLKRAWVDALHFQQLKRFGGAYGVRDDGAVESALARPRNRWGHDEGTDLASLAAEYGFGLARNHGYAAANKRIAFLAMAAFLERNGLRLDAPEPEVVRTIAGLAAGDIDLPALADWLRRRTHAPDADVDRAPIA